VHTYSTALGLIGATVPGHLVADAGVPVLTGPQAQGDLLVLPVADPGPRRWPVIPAAGVQVVHGEATGNTHWLHRGFDSPGVSWCRRGERTDEPDDPALPADELTVGYVQVPAGQSALLIHTDEHGANGIGPGTYAIRRKRQATLTFTGRSATELVCD